MSDFIDTMQVCVNGHKITDYYEEYPGNRKNFCDKCGAKTIHQCEKCDTPIQGFHSFDGIIGGEEPDIPSHCRSCGEAYPWTTTTNKKSEEVSGQNLTALHPTVIEVSSKLFSDGHYSQAIFEAYKAVIAELKTASGLPNLDGKQLAEAAFSLNSPKVKLSNLQTQSEKDEQQGFMFLYAGAALGVRNPKAHDNIAQNDKQKTFEYLCFASLLLRCLDERLTNE